MVILNFRLEIGVWLCTKPLHKSLILFDPIAMKSVKLTLEPLPKWTVTDPSSDSITVNGLRLDQTPGNKIIQHRDKVLPKIQSDRTDLKSFISKWGTMCLGLLTKWNPILSPHFWKHNICCILKPRLVTNLKTWLTPRPDTDPRLIRTNPRPV